MQIDRQPSVKKFLQLCDEAYDAMLFSLNCHDGGDAYLISHWQEAEPQGYRIQVTRKSDGRSQTRFVSRAAST